MAVGAIIAEYNPFHRGHAYQLQKTKEVATDGVVVILSGNFTQRAEGAIIPKDVRARVAVAHGADLVVELPLPFATATAQKFALGGVAIAEGMGIVDLLCMGSEHGDIDPLIGVADALENLEIGPYLKEGVTFAVARQNALEEKYPHLGGIIQKPNNILAIEYIRSIKALGSSIVPMTVLRQGVGHDQKETSGEFASASALRQIWLEEGVGEKMNPFVPEGAWTVYKEENPFDYNLFQTFSMPLLRQLTLEEIQRLPNIAEGLENRVYNAIKKETNYQDILKAIETKRYTRSRLQRILLNGTLGITSEDLSVLPPYIRILAIGEKGSGLLRQMKEKATLPFSHSLRRLEEENPLCKRFAQLESKSSDLYYLCTTPPRGREEEYQYRLHR